MAFALPLTKHLCENSKLLVNALILMYFLSLFSDQVATS